MITRQRRTGKLHTGFAPPGCPLSARRCLTVRYGKSRCLRSTRTRCPLGFTRLGWQEKPHGSPPDKQARIRPRPAAQNPSLPNARSACCKTPGSAASTPACARSKTPAASLRPGVWQTSPLLSQDRQNGQFFNSLLGEAMRTAVEKRSGCLCRISPYLNFRHDPAFKLREL
jgi:hypothetical protein